ncbi:MAG: efflux RND transporter periplasmic adaptor subunit, partial [Spirochaetia bacterium]|nr:efflux RND transporter periplasmic adaptor subunit [Spirochaetia bacterium]
AEVIDLSQIVVRGTSYERPDVLRIQKGNLSTATSELYPAKEFRGVVWWIEPGFDSENKTLRVGVVIDNSDGQLRRGMQMSLNTEVGEAQEILAAPKRAVLGETGNYFVFVRDSLDKNQFEKRSVVVGENHGNEIEIREGVFPGEEVVVQGNYQLQYATSLPPTKAPTKESGSSKSFLKRTWIYWIIGFLLISAVVLFIRFRRHLGQRSKSAWSGN